jgi:hypothetical protein
MDVRLPDGTVIKNVPDGTTKAQLISKLKSNGYDVSGLEAKQPEVTGEVGFFEGIRKSPAVRKLAETAERIAPSPEEVVSGMGESALNLPESAIGMVAAGYGLAEGIMGLTTPEGRAAAGRAISNVPQAVHRAMLRAETDPVGTIESAARFAKQDPLGAMAAVSGLTGFGSAAMGLTKTSFAPPMFRKFMGGMEFGAPELSKLSQITDPLAVPFLAAQGVGAGYNRFVSPVVSQAGAERAAGNKLLESVMGRPEDVAAAFRNEPASIIGQVPASQRLAEARLYEPKLATLEADLVTGETEVGRQSILLEQRRLQGIQQQLHAIDQQILRQGQAMSPEARAQLDEVRNSLLREQAAAQRQIQQPLQATGAAIPAVGQRAPGEAVAARAAELREDFRKKVVRPAYNKAFQLAGKAKGIDVSNVLDEAQRILGRPISILDVSTTPQAARQINKIAREAVPGEFVSLGEYGGYSLEPSGMFKPTKVDLQTADAIRKAINNEIAAISDLSPDANIKRSGLNKLHALIDQAVETGDVSDAAKNAYRQALGVYREQYVPRFRTGVAFDLLRTTKKNQSGIIPSKTVKGFLANEDTAAQFAATFGDDAVARSAMESGIQDLARQPGSKIVDETGAVVPENVDVFVNKYRRQFDLMGIDGDALLGPVRQEAEALRRGMAELDREAAFFRTSNGEALRKGADFVDEMLKDPAAMQVGLRRLSEEGRSALTKEVVDRAIRSINSRAPEDALKYLADNKTSIRMALDQPYYDRLITLAENQRALFDVEKHAAKPVVQLDVDLSNVPPEVLTDFGMVAREIDRIKKAEAMMGLRPAQKVGEIGAEDIKAAKNVKPDFIDSRLSIMEKIMDVAGRYLNRKTAAILADTLTRNPSKAADLLEQAAARKAAAAAPRAPESRARTAGRAALMGGLVSQNQMSPENQNAMSRR